MNLFQIRKIKQLFCFSFNFLITNSNNCSIVWIIIVISAIFQFLSAIPLRSRWILDQFDHERFSLRLPPKSLSCLVKSRKAAGVNTNGIPRRDPPPLFSKLPLSSGAHSLFRRYARHRLLEGTSRLNPSRVVRRHFSRERIINRL